MLTRRNFNALLASLPGVLACGGALRADPAVTIQVASWGSPSHINIAEFVPVLEQYLAEHSGGRIAVRHFPSGQLAQDSEMPVAIPTGRVQVGWTTLAVWSGLVPDAGIGSLPAGLTMDQFARAIEGENGLHAVLDRQFRQKNARLFAVTDLGPVAIVSKKPMLGPEDFKGVRTRVFSEGTARLLQALGGAPLQIPFADVYTALQRGTIDAAVVGFQGVQSQRLYEVCDYLMTPASFCGTGLQGYAGNLEWWDDLEAGDQTLIEAGMKAAELHCRDAIAADRTQLEERYRAEGMEVVALEAGMPEHSAWREAVAPVLEQEKANYSAEILAPVLEQMEG